MQSDNILRPTGPYKGLNPLVVLQNLVNPRLNVHRLDHLVLDLIDYQPIFTFHLDLSSTALIILVEFS